MSVVIAFKFKDGMILGADKRVTLYGHLKEDNVSKIFHTRYSGHAIGCAGYLRHANIIAAHNELMKYEDILEQVDIDQTYIVNVMIPSLIEYLKNANALENPEGFCMWGSELLYVTKSKIFRIGSDFSVIEYSHWATIGCGMEMVTGILSNMDDKEFEKLKEKDAIGLMEMCITNGCSRDNAVSPDFEYALIT